ncbi:hypothetical protein BSKO_06490 [Bryopsis sp. KO-2023]|nr:hypothetical protein BSKO_06490 [Bryopsis sp. KO-2023]
MDFFPSLGEEDAYPTDVGFIKLNESVQSEVPLLPDGPPGLGMKMLTIGKNEFDGFFSESAMVIACNDAGFDAQHDYFCAANNFFEPSCRADSGSLIISQGRNVSEDVLFGILVEGQKCDHKKKPDKVGELFVSLFEQRKNIVTLMAGKPIADIQEPLTLDGAFLPLFLVFPVCVMAARVFRKKLERICSGEFPFLEFKVTYPVAGIGWVKLKNDEVRRRPNKFVRFGSLTWEKHPSAPIAVAVKYIRVRVDGGAKKRWEEHQNAIECSQGHSNVVSYYPGWHARSAIKTQNRKGLEVCEYLLTMEKMEMNLMEYVESEQVGTYGDVLRVLLGVAEGMAYLHKRNIIHCDLKMENVMLDARKIPKITDFGDAKLKNEVYATHQSHENFGYIAPEVRSNEYFTCANYNSSVDVYSFGVMMWECLEGVFSGSLKPKGVLSGKTSGTIMWGADGQRYCTTEEPICRLIEQCLRFDEVEWKAAHVMDLESPSGNHGRPSFGELHVAIDGFLQQPWASKKLPWKASSTCWVLGSSMKEG